MTRLVPKVSVPCPDPGCSGVLRLSFAGLGHLLGCGEALRCPECHKDMRKQLTDGAPDGMPVTGL